MEKINIHVSRNTNSRIAELLYRSYLENIPVRIYYGNTDTGEDYLQLHGTEGVVTSSKGGLPVFQLETDIGVFPIETENIVKLKVNGEVVYQHPFYHVPTIEVQPLSNGVVLMKTPTKVITSGACMSRLRRIFQFINE